MSQDTLSQVLRSIRLRGAVFYHVEGNDRWVSEAPPARAIAALSMSMSRLDPASERHGATLVCGFFGCDEHPFNPLLRQSSAPIASIALEVGYESESAFSRAFRREVGQPPAAWRRERARLGAGAA